MKRFKNILCVLESNKSASLSLQRATSLAENNQAGLTVVQVIPRITAGIGMPDGGPISTELQSALLKTHREEIDSWLKPYQGGTNNIQVKILMGTPFLEIIREVIRHEYDLVIKSAETSDWLDRLFASDDMHLLRKCPCPVWLIKPSEAKSYRRIMVAVDVDDAYPEEEMAIRQQLNQQILEMAGSMALADFAELHIVHAWQAIGEGLMRGAFMNTPEDDITTYVTQVKQKHETSLETLVNEMTTKLGKDALDYIKPHIKLLKGSPRKEIPAYANEIDADLLVMGTVARTGIPGYIMGNTAETILSQIDASVLAVKPPGFHSPVRLED